MPDSYVLMPFKNNDHTHQHCLDTALLTAEKTCQARGVRLTKLRRRVLELVWGSHEPVKAYDILDQLRNEPMTSGLLPSHRSHPASLSRRIFWTPSIERIF